MDFLQLLNQPFMYGVAATLLLVLGGWILSGGPRRLLRLEVRRKNQELQAKETQLNALREQLHIQMEINSKGHEEIKKERNQLVEQIKHLEINVATLQQKPGRAERRQLTLYQHALERMFSEAPGFATAWQNALAKSEEDMSKKEQGIGGFLRGIVTKKPLLTHSSEEGEEHEKPSRLEDEEHS